MSSLSHWYCLQRVGQEGTCFPHRRSPRRLAPRGVTIDLATDHRAERYGNKFPARRTHIVASETLRGPDPLSIVRTAVTLGMGRCRRFASLAASSLMRWWGLADTRPSLRCWRRACAGSSP